MFYLFFTTAFLCPVVGAGIVLTVYRQLTVIVAGDLMLTTTNLRVDG